MTKMGHSTEIIKPLVSEEVVNKNETIGIEAEEPRLEQENIEEFSGSTDKRTRGGRLVRLRNRLYL